MCFLCHSSAYTCMLGTFHKKKLSAISFRPRSIPPAPSQQSHTLMHKTLSGKRSAHSSHHNFGKLLAATGEACLENKRPSERELSPGQLCPTIEPLWKGIQQALKKCPSNTSVGWFASPRLQNLCISQSQPQLRTHLHQLHLDVKGATARVHHLSAHCDIAVDGDWVHQLNFIH